MPRNDIEQTDFPIHAPCPVGGEFYEPLVARLAQEIGLPAGVTNRTGGSCMSFDGDPWSLVGDGVTEVVGAIRVLQLKKSSYGDTLMVEYAAFLPDGRALVWSDGFGCGGTAQRYTHEERGVFFDTEVKRKVRALIKWTPPAPAV